MRASGRLSKLVGNYTEREREVKHEAALSFSVSAMAVVVAVLCLERRGVSRIKEGFLLIAMQRN